jgi:hypothetical protein
MLSCWISTFGITWLRFLPLIDILLGGLNSLSCIRYASIFCLFYSLSPIYGVPNSTTSDLKMPLALLNWLQYQVYVIYQRKRAVSQDQTEHWGCATASRDNSRDWYLGGGTDVSFSVRDWRRSRYTFLTDVLCCSGYAIRPKEIWRFLDRVLAMISHTYFENRVHCLVLYGKKTSTLVASNVRKPTHQNPQTTSSLGRSTLAP